MKNAAKMPTVKPARPIAATAWPTVVACESLDERGDHRAEPEDEHREVADEHRTVRPAQIRGRAGERPDVVLEHGSRELPQLERRTNRIPVPRAGQPHHHGMPS